MSDDDIVVLFSGICENDDGSYEFKFDKCCIEICSAE